MNFVRRFAAKIAFPSLFRGKNDNNIVDANRGWEALDGNVIWKKGDDIWEAYSSAQMEAIVRTHAIIFACVRKIYTAAQEAELEIGRDTKSGWELMDNHPMLSLLMHPNAEMSFGDLVSRFLSHLLLTGESYIWKFARDGMEEPAELWTIPTSWVEKKYDESGRLAFYSVYQGLGKTRVAVPPIDMIVAMFPDPSNPGKGLGPMQACSYDQQLDQERANYIVEMLHNMKMPGIVLKQAEGWSPEQKNEARELLASLIGSGKRGSPLFLEGEKASAELMVPLKDLDWPGLTSLSESRICAAFGVPPILVGARAGLEHSTYSNYEQADRSFYREMMVPLWHMMGDVFTRSLLWAESGEVDETYFQFYLEDVRQLQEDTKEAAERAVKLWQGGLVTRGEARIIAGQEPLNIPEMDEVLLRPAMMIEVNIHAPQLLLSPPPEEGEEEEEEPELLDWTEEDATDTNKEPAGKVRY